ncbi:MAG: helix-turn-helix transcriptional regulator [Lachnospiraceae bacterium]|nr:helix-turn-helix transcriptional regulator [Lachnospiraceae bacterium]
MIVYDNLWKTLKNKNISQYKLIKDYGISAGQLSRLRKNAYINTHTLDILCDILQCNVEDVMTHVPK